MILTFEKGLREKSIEFYNQKNDNFLFDQVNVEAFLESLKDNQEEMTESAFMDKEEGKPPRFKDCFNFLF